MQNSGILIIGAGQAGSKLTQTLIAAGYVGKITLLGEEAHLPYERPPLSKAALKDPAAEPGIFTIPPQVFEAPNLDWRPGTRVTALDTERHSVTLDTGETLMFEKAVIASGGRAVRLPLPGAELCLNLRTLDDARDLRPRLAPGTRLAILGGGVIGMEVAATALELGCAVTVIEAGSRIMSRILSPLASELLERHHLDHGLMLRKEVQAKAIAQSGEGYLLTLSDGSQLQADLVLSAVGIRPNVEFVMDAKLGASGGILTDAYGRLPGAEVVFAIGDVAEWQDQFSGFSVRLETWRNADKQAKTLARTLMGEETAHRETPWMWSDQLGRNIQVVGLYDPDVEEHLRAGGSDNATTILWTKRGRLIGGVLIDNGRERRFLEELTDQGACLSDAELRDATLPLKTLAKGRQAA